MDDIIKIVYDHRIEDFTHIITSSNEITMLYFIS